jgi:MscS family membrane protein
MSEHSTQFFQFFDTLENLPYSAETGAFAIFFLFLFLRSVFARIVIGFAKKITEKTTNTIDDELVAGLERPIKFLFIIIGLSLSLNILTLPVDWDNFIQPIIAALYTYTLFWALFSMIRPIARALFSIGNKMGRALNEDLQHFFIRTMEVIVLAIGAVAILEQWNINVSAFLGGLGLAGMAVALAAKDSVANLFGTLMIFADRTFQKGDWIQTPQVEGTIEIIGLRASKIRTFSKALVSVPNADLANSPITNWSRMTHRRIKMTLGLEYRTTAKQLESIVNRLRDFIANDEHVEIKGPVAQMVHLTEFGASSININLYYFTKTTDWEDWRQIRNDHILAFKRIVEEEGAGFAFPSTSLYVEQMPSEEASMS